MSILDRLADYALIRTAQAKKIKSAEQIKDEALPLWIFYLMLIVNFYQQRSGNFL